MCNHARLNACSEGLRKKIPQALWRGSARTEAARTFGVRRSSVKRYAKLADEGRPLAPKNPPVLKPKMGRLRGNFWRSSKAEPRPSSGIVASSLAQRAESR